MKTFIIVILSLLAAIIQLSLLPHLAIFGIVPNILASLVVAWGIVKKEEKNSWLILLPVFFYDFLGGEPFGFFTLSALFVFYLVGRLAQSFFIRHDILAVLALSFLGVSSFDLFQGIFLKLATLLRLADSGSLFSLDYFLKTLPLLVLINAVSSVIFVGLIKRLKHK